MGEDIDVACSLSSPEFRQREATLLAEFKSKVTSIEELQNGFAFRIPGDEKSLRLAADLMVAERHCCTFFTFQLTAEAKRGPLTMRITGPEGTKEFVKSILL